MGKNSYSDQVLSTYAGTSRRRDLSLPNSEWAVDNLTYELKHISFADYPFQVDMLNDNHPEQVTIKLSQVGITSVAMMKARVWLGRHEPISGFFTFSDDAMRKTNASTRLLPFFDENDDAQENNLRGKNIRNQNVIQLRRSLLHITNATDGASTSIPADFLMHDEADRCDPAILGQFLSRLQNSTFQKRWRFGTPLFANFGVDRQFKDSDQHMFLHQCPKCNTWQELDFNGRTLGHPSLDIPEDIFQLEAFDRVKHRLVDLYLKCSHCHEPVNQREMKKQWVAKYPDRTDLRGRRLRPFCSPRHSPSYFMSRFLEALTDTTPGVFSRMVNTLLGQTHKDSNFRLEPDTIRQAFRSPTEIPTDTPLYLGADRGSICHVLLMDDHDRVVHMEHCYEAQFEERIVELHQQYPNIVAGCIDRYPGAGEAGRIYRDTQGKIHPVHFTSGVKAPDIKYIRDAAEPNVISIDDYLQANRVNALERVREGVAQLEGITFHVDPSFHVELEEHLSAVAKVIGEDNHVTHIKLTQVDHWFFALAYAKTAQVTMDKPFISRTQKVETRSVLAVMAGRFGPDNPDDDKQRYRIM